METKVNIMDLEVDIISIDYLILNCKGFLTNDILNTIYLVSTKSIQETIEDDSLKDCFKHADFVLPGDDTVLSFHHVDTLQTEGMIVDYHFLYPMFESISDEVRTLFIVCRNEREVELYKSFHEARYKNLKIVGSFIASDLEKEELVINEINSVAPDILIFAIDSPFQEKWISSNYQKLNSKLCIGLGRVIDDIFKENKELPRLIKKFHLEKFYLLFRHDKNVRKLRETHTFRKRVEAYKNRKIDKNKDMQ